MAKCPRCGAPMEKETCDYCGYVEDTVSYGNDILHQEMHSQIVHPRDAVTNQLNGNASIIPGISQKRKIVALLLCIFLGGVGAHKFYVGKIGMGILYLFTAGLFGVGWIIDIFLIAMGLFRDEFDLPLRD